MDQAQITEFVAMINSQVGIVHDENLRKQNETLIVKFREEKSDLFIQLLLHALKNEQEAHVRTYCASQLRKNLSEYSEKSYINLWEKLSAETQATFKQQIFQCLDSESASNIRSLICDAIGEVGACLIESHEEAKKGKNEWPELMNLVNTLFKSERIPLIEAGYKIFTNLLIYTSTTFDNHREELRILFQQGFQNQDLSVKVATVQCIGAFVETVEPKNLTKFEDLVPALLETTLIVLNQDQDLGETCLSTIAEICEDSALIFKKNFSIFFQTMFQVFQKKDIDSIGLKKITMEALILVIENYPGLVKNNDEYKKNLIEMIFFYMIDMDEEVSEEWQKPAEGFRECFQDDGDNANTTFGMNSIDRLMDTIGQEKFMPVLSATVENLLQNQDWRYPFASLMALSQIGEYLDGVNDITTIAPVIFKFIENANPKIRYAALHAVGQIADDMQPDFQEKFGPQILPVLIKAMDDPVPRVQAHALASMTNFMEGANQQQVAPFLEEALKKSIILLENGISLVKENAISNIAGLAEAADDTFNNYYKETIPLISAAYTKHPGKEYKQLRGCVIEAITVIGDAIDKELFLPYLGDTVSLIVQIQESDLEQVDPQKNFVLTGLSRICQKYSEEFVQYLPQVIPSVVKVIQQIIEQREEMETQVEAGTTGHSFQHKEAESAMNMLELFIERLGANLGPYIQQFTEILLPLCQFQWDEDIRCQASKCLPGLIRAVVGSNRDLSIKLVREFIKLLYSAATNEFDAQTINSQVQGMKGCIEAVGLFLGQEELNELSQKIIDLLIESDQRKQGNRETAASDQLDDDEKKLFELDTTHEEELHVAIAELLGVIFKTHPDQSAQLADKIYSEFLPKVLGDTVSQRMHQFGIFLIDDMVEFLEFQRVGGQWAHLCEALIKFATAYDLKVRQATVYGIGIFAQKTPKDQFAQYAQPLLEVLSKAIQIECGQNQPQKSYQHCKDNTIAAIGKICQAQWENIQQLPQILTSWLGLLPLKKDKPEAFIQHEFLCDIILNNQTKEVLFGNTQNYNTTLTLFAQIIDSKLSNKQINEKIRQCIPIISQTEYVKANWESIAASIPQEQLAKLQN